LCAATCADTPKAADILFRILGYLILYRIRSYVCLFYWSGISNIFSKLFRNFHLFAFLNIVNVFSMFPYVCPESNIWLEYPVSGRLLRIA
jgi:hypothetical protein